MRAGDIIFVKGKGWLSDIIEEVDVGEFSHVCIAVNEKEIFEAQYYMRSKKVPMHYNLDDCIVLPLSLTDREVEKLGIICEAITGKRYDYIQDIGYLFRKWFGISMSRFNNHYELICSEAVGLILYLLDKINSPLRNITPNELYNYLLKEVIT